jgi:hypothetical protein
MLRGQDSAGPQGRAGACRSRRQFQMRDRGLQLIGLAVGLAADEEAHEKMGDRGIACFTRAETGWFIP